MIRVLIVDDEPLARRRIRNLLREHSEMDVIGECGNADEAIFAIQKDSPDLVFLDVQMPGKDGFDLLRHVDASQMPVVIFVTAHDKYAVRAFEIYALDYLLKPFNIERFEQTLQRAILQIQREKGGDLGRRVLAMMNAAVRPREKFIDRLIAKSGEMAVFLRTEEVDWIGAEGNYMRLHVGKKSYLLRETINNLEAQLDLGKFLRVHRSTIVNIERVKGLEPWFQHGEYVVILTDGTRLNLSRHYRERIQKMMPTATGFTE